MYVLLNDHWKVGIPGEDKIPAAVPGSVFLDYLNAGKIEDPYYRENEKNAILFAKNDFVYTCDFSVPDALLSEQVVELCFDGVDTLSKITLNGITLGTTNDMFRQYRFEVTPFLKAGQNHLEVHIFSAVRYGEEKAKEEELVQSDYSLPGIGHLRKGQYMFGWDWGPMVADTGLFRKVYLEGFSHMRLENVRIRQIFEDSAVTVELLCSTVFAKEEGVVYRAEITSPDGNVFSASSKDPCFSIRIPEPSYWWPHGFGKQNLYQVKVSVFTDETERDNKEFRIGIRRIEIVQEPDEFGTSFRAEVNGVPVFLKGGDYIPEDNLLSRCSKERTEKLLKSCIEANHNAIRVWGGGIYQEDYFYDLCDELGILVWQDFMFACGTYNTDEPDFRKTTIEEIKYNICRIRNHACLLLFCGNNENEGAHLNENMKNLEVARRRYLDFFEEVIPGLVKEYAPDTFYWPSSPSSGGHFDDPGDAKRGDMHYWGVWHERKPFTEYRKICPRMMTECGIQAFPSYRTLVACTGEQDRNIFTKVMERHQKGGIEANERILYYISQRYRYPSDLYGITYLSQLIQAEGLKYGVEHWRSIYGQCMGVFYWQLNDCWPAASWSGIDYYGRWKALHYYGKKFYAPVLILAKEEDRTMDVYLVNDGKENKKVTVTWKLMDFSGNVLLEETSRQETKGLGSQKIISLDFTDTISEEEREDRLVYLEAKEGEAILSKNIVYFTVPKYIEYEKPDLTVTVEETKREYRIRIAARTLVKSLYLDMKEKEVHFSDNFFDVIPGIEECVTVSKEDHAGLTRQDLEEQMIFYSVYDTYHTK